MPSPAEMITQISKCLVRPSALPPVNICHLTPFDLAMLSPHYIQKGLLFTNIPPSFSIETIIDRLKSSLSVALYHFYPLSGRLVTKQVLDDDSKVKGIYISIHCKSQGAEFIHAVASSIKVEEVLAPLSDVPSFVNSLFPLNHVVGHDGHSQPLLAVQLTELHDGVFVACSFNHVVGDGSSYWHFFNAWAEISRSIGGVDFPISRPPVHEKWFIEGERPPVILPYPNLDDRIERYCPPPLREKIFHFTSQSIAKLKEKANKECGTNHVSSFQSLSALVWRCITRARCLPDDQQTTGMLAIQDRARVRPPLSPDYFGNVIFKLPTTTTAGELTAHGLGWAALKLNHSIANHTDNVVRGLLKKYHENPVVYTLSQFDKCSIMMGSSPRFDMYACDFGWGKAVGLRSGPGNKFEGKVTSYPGWEGGGSIDLEVCLKPEHMDLLELDEEFMDAVSTYSDKV